MIILIVSMTVWFLVRLIFRKPRKQTAPAALPAPPIKTAAQIEKEKAKAERDAEKERAKAKKEQSARELAQIDARYYAAALKRYADIKGNLLTEKESVSKELSVVRSLPGLVDNPTAYQNTYAKLDAANERKLCKRLAEIEKDIVQIDAKAYAAYKNLLKAKNILNA